MKAQILKIAGVKSEKEFYKKFPSEAAFMKVHGKEFKKAQLGAALNPIGSYMSGSANPASPKNISFDELQDDVITKVTGVSAAERRRQEELAAEQAAAETTAATQQGGGDSGGGLGGLTKMLSAFGGGEGGGGMEALAGLARHGAHIRKAQMGIQTVPTAPGTMGTPMGMANVPSSISSQTVKPVNPGSLGKAKGAGFFKKAGAYGQKADEALKPLGGLAGSMGPLGQIIEDIDAIKQQKEELKAAQQQVGLTSLIADAAAIRPEQPERKYVRPEDAIFQPEQLNAPQGAGSNILTRNGGRIKKAQGGMQIGGNLTEIQNTYAPNDLYDDLGYEPLSDSEIVKQYRQGGLVKAASGLDMFAGAGGGQVAGTAGQYAGQMFGNRSKRPNAGGQLGGTIGKTAGMFFGPGGAEIGDFLGTAIGTAFDPTAKRIEDAEKQAEKNIMRASVSQFGQQVQNQYTGFMREGGELPLYEEGGWVSHDWQPQVIAHFGEHSMKDLLREDKTMDTLRTGGRITQNNMFPQDQYAMGGELKTTWGGYAEPISQNPYLPGTGETVMFRGKSHEESDGNGHTGIGVKYGAANHDSYTDYAEYGTEMADADVEVERGEPAVKLEDGETGEENLIVYGNLQIPDYGVAELQDPKAKGKKFKNYINDLSKTEARQSKIMDRATTLLEDLDPQNSFDQLSIASANAMMQGANMKLKEIASKKTIAAGIQNAINDTAEEHGLVADDLAKGKIKEDKEARKQMAKWGAKMETAQDGVKKLSKLEALKDIPKGQSKGKVYYGGITDKDVEQLKANNAWYDWTNFNPARKEDVRKFQKAFNAEAKKVGSSARIKEDDQLGKQTASAKGLYDETTPSKDSFSQLQNLDWGKGRQYTVQDFERKAPKTYEEFVGETPKKKGSDYMNLLNMAAPFIRRPSNMEAFDYRSLTPEYFALATNQLEPVDMQLYSPLLEQPFDISLQDQLNANQADFNALQRQQGYNPEALSILAAQKYAANSGVLGNQFRMNQAEKAGVYNRNRQTLNDAQAANLNIMDLQAGRQALAKSKTKQQAFDALSSISDKIARNKLRNRELGVYENLYNYRFGRNDMRAYNVNDPYRFNTEGRVWSGETPTYDAQGNVIVPPAKSVEKKDEKGKKTSTTSNTTTAFPTFDQYSTTINKTKKPVAKPTYGSLSTSIFDKKKSRNGSIVKAIKNL